MSLKTGDKVIVIAGKNKGTRGKIVRVLKNDNKVIVEGVNMIKKHLKPNANNQNGGIVQKEAPIHISNVMLIDPKTDKRTRKQPAKEVKTEKEEKTVKKEVKEKKETKTSKPKKAKVD